MSENANPHYGNVECAVDVEALSVYQNTVPLAIALVIYDKKTGEFLYSFYESIEEGFTTTDDDTLRFWNDPERCPGGVALLKEYKNMAKPAVRVAYRMVNFLYLMFAHYGRFSFLTDCPSFDIGNSLDEFLRVYLPSELSRTRTIIGGYDENSNMKYGGCTDPSDFQEGIEFGIKWILDKVKIEVNEKQVTFYDIKKSFQEKFDTMPWPAKLRTPVLKMKHDCLYDAAKTAYVHTSIKLFMENPHNIPSLVFP